MVMKNLIFIIAMVLLSAIIPMLNTATAECKLPGKNHDDNKPLSWKAHKLIKEGANLCEVAKKCDKMEIDVSIKDKKELHQTEMYKTATPEQQKELDESATRGNGHDDPNLKCYEVEYSVKE